DLLFVLLWLLGPPVLVRATSRRFYGPFEDEIHTMMALPGGAEVGLDCSWSVPGYPRQSSVIEAEGANGKMLISDDALEVELASGHGPLPSGPLSTALGAGVAAVLASPLPVLLAAVAELKQTVPIYALLPALTEHERNDFEPGVEGLIERARGSAGLLARLRAGWSGLARPAALYRGDLARRLPLLIELEVARLSPRALKGVVLDACLTDLVLAAGKRAFFDSYCRFVRRRFGAAAGLETHNLGLLLARLREWDLRPDLVVGPLNPCGRMRKPSVAEVLDELKRTDVPVVAKELRAGGVVS